MYCYCCGSIKTGRICAVCGADERKRYAPQTAEGKALRDLFDMQDIGPESTIGNPRQFELLVTDVLPSDRFTYFRMQLNGIVSVYTVSQLLMNQIKTRQPPEDALFVTLCRSAQETGYAQETCRNVIQALYEMIGWSVPAAPAAPAPAPKPTPRPAPKPAQAPKPAPARKPAPTGDNGQPVDGDDVTVRVELTAQEADAGCVKKVSVHRKEICPLCFGAGKRKGHFAEICLGCNGTGLKEADTVLTLTFDPQPGKASFRKRFTGAGNQGAHGGKKGDLLVMGTIKRPKPAAPAPKPAAPAPRPGPSAFDGKDGSDLTVHVQLTTRENEAGCTKTIKYTRQKPCSACGGKGTSVGGRKCIVCGGAKTVSQSDEVTVTIPPHPGQSRYTLPVVHGRGNTGIDSGRDGNLFLLVEVEGSAAKPAAPGRTLPQSAPAPRSVHVRVGQHFRFGHYPQSSDGKDNTGIIWVVLAVQGTRALVVSKYGLDTKPYGSGDNVTWAGSTLRTWLNGEFLNRAFNGEEQRHICVTTVDNGESQGYKGWHQDGGGSTRDRVFVLSCTEKEQYFKADSGVEAQSAPTFYAQNRGAYAGGLRKTSEGKPAGWWWLRSPGSAKGHAAIVYLNGSINSCSTAHTSVSVRPAMWIDTAAITS